MSFTITTSSEDATRTVGRLLALALRPGDVVGLIGTLGAGKTTFVKGVADGLNLPVRIYVTSPTFTIVNEYPTTPRLLHFDFYRLSEPDELIETGWDDAVSGDAICLVEWFDILPEAAPRDWLEVRLLPQGDARTLTFVAHGEDWLRRLASLARDGTLVP